MPDPRSHKLDVVALALLALVLFVGVALVTYHSSDLTAQSNPAPQPFLTAPHSTLVPIPNSTASATHKLANACGRSGAYVAEATRIQDRNQVLLALYRFLDYSALGDAQG